MSDSYDEQLMAAMRLPEQERVEAMADRSRALYAKYQETAPGLADRIIADTQFMYDRSVSVRHHREALRAHLDTIEQATTGARKALDELARLGDYDLLPYLGHDVVIQHAMATITLAVAGAKHHAPDPDAPETRN